MIHLCYCMIVTVIYNNISGFGVCAHEKMISGSVLEKKNNNFEKKAFKNM